MSGPTRSQPIVVYCAEKLQPMLLTHSSLAPGRFEAAQRPSTCPLQNRPYETTTVSPIITTLLMPSQLLLLLDNSQALSPQLLDRE